MKTPNLKIQKAFPDAKIPERAHPTDSCVDLRAYRFEFILRGEQKITDIDGKSLEQLDTITLEPLDRTLVNTGIIGTVGKGYELQIRARSSALKNGLILANGIGTIDESYRGVLGVALINVSGIRQTIDKGDRIAQLAVSPVIISKIEEVDNLDDTERGSGGFGSTGRK